MSFMSMRHWIDNSGESVIFCEYRVNTKIRGQGRKVLQELSNLERTTTIFHPNLSCVGPTKKRAGARVNGRLVCWSRNPADVKNDQSGEKHFFVKRFWNF